ncbi:MAG: hypothetical protein H6660_10040 [Ardenticatenaceae bacterium]|nr:hypothetical protein [Ardenticatenaceae bacterium]
MRHCNDKQGKTPIAAANPSRVMMGAWVGNGRIFPLRSPTRHDTITPDSSKACILDKNNKSSIAHK